MSAFAGRSLIGILLAGGLPQPSASHLRVLIPALLIGIRAALVGFGWVSFLAVKYPQALIEWVPSVQVFVTEYATVALVARSGLLPAGLIAARIGAWIWVPPSLLPPKYDSVQVLSSSSASLRDEVDRDRLLAALLHAVEETVQPAPVSL